MIPSSSPEQPTSRPGLLARITSPTGLAVASLLSIILVFYHRLWLPDLVLIKRDAFRFFLPLKQYLVERLTAGELPQWFPYEALGRSFIGVTHTGIFHPFTALYLLLPVPDAYRASTLLSCLLAAVGAFVLGRTLNISHTGSLIAGVSFALSGFVVSLTENLLYLYSICALPLFCAGLEKALVGNRAWVVGPAVIWATVFWNGDVQTGYYYIFIALLWIGTRAPGSYRETGIRLALIGGLAALLAGIQLGPAWAVFIDSERAHPILFKEQPLIWSTHPLRLATVLVGPVGENADPAAVAGFFFDTPYGNLWAESLYQGIPVTWLAILGIWYRRDLRALALLGGLALLLSLGKYAGLYEIFYHVVPLWSAFRYPEKFMGIVSFAVAMLAGAGFDTLWARTGRSAFWLTASIICLGFWLGLRTEAASAWTAASFGAPEPLAHEMASSTALAFLFSALTALGVWIVLVGIRKRWLRLELLLAFLIVIIMLDLSRANLGAYHTAPVEAATFIPSMVEALRMREGTLEPGRFRIISMGRSDVVAPEQVYRWLGYYGAASIDRRQAIDAEHNAQFHIETATRYLAVPSASFLSLLQQKPGIAVAARYNVTYYIGRKPQFQKQRFVGAFVAERPDYDLALFRNPVPAKPRVYLSRRPERANSSVDPATLIARPDFLSGEVDVIETSDANLPGPAREGTAVIERYAPEEVRVRVETPQPAVLILLDAFDQGWTATLEDGVEVPIRRANALVRAVVVPAGAHMITFRYETPLLYAGAAASLFGVLLSLSLIVHARWRACQEDPVP
jgi:hypothetical protein